MIPSITVKEELPMKKLIAIVLTVLLIAALTACARTDPKAFLEQQLAAAKTPSDEQIVAALDTIFAKTGLNITEDGKAQYIELTRAMLDTIQYEVLSVTEDKATDTATASIKVTAADMGTALSNATKALTSELVGRPDFDPAELSALMIEKMIEAIRDPALGTKEHTVPVLLKYDKDQKTWLTASELMDQLLTNAMSS